MSKLIIPPHIRRGFRDRTATFTWGGSNAPYAPQVHNLRPWTVVGLAETDIRAIVIKDFNSSGNLAGAFDKSMKELSAGFKVAIDDFDFALPSRGQKKYRSGRTWGKITDSGALAKSQKLRLG
jgi:hypothetical protein